MEKKVVYDALSETAVSIFVEKCIAYQKGTQWFYHNSILDMGSDVQNMNIEANIDIKGTAAFKYLRSIFTDSGKCKEEVLNRIEKAGKAGRALNSLVWIKRISLNPKTTNILTRGGKHFKLRL
jgi:hypothetical protein